MLFRSGEHWTCPKCGEKTEVYSRITGYYRPLQNWNDGKSQEFLDRKEYLLGNSHLSNKTGDCCLNKVDHQEETHTSIKELMLFTSKTCPNCKMAKMILDNANIKYQNIDAYDNKELTLEYGVYKAPTLLVPTKSGYIKYENASLIKKYVEDLGKNNGDRKSVV